MNLPLRKLIALSVWILTLQLLHGNEVNDNKMMYGYVKVVTRVGNLH